MNQKVFADTNIVLDLLLMRKSFYQAAAQLFSFADKKRIVVCISALTFTTVHYILLKQIGAEKARNTLAQLRTLVTILPVNNNIIDQALISSFKDFEDAVQYYCAVSAGIPFLLTRNIKDYQDTEISVMSVVDYLEIYKNQPKWKK